MGITLQKIAGAVLFALILVISLNLLVNGILPVTSEKPSTSGAVAPESPTPASGGGPEKPLGQRLAGANTQTGQATAKVCQSCHNFVEGAGAKVGPDLYGVVGRPKASASGFAYSDALKKKGGDWTYDDLDNFLTKPSAFAPGTKMTFAGLPDADKRADVIAYLKSISPNAPPEPPPQ
jgi:cytochrome c